MKLRMTLPVAISLAFASLAMGAPPAVTPPAKSDSAVSLYKFLGLKQGSAWGRPVWLVFGSPVAGGGPVEMVIPNNDPNAKKLDPVVFLYDAIKNAKQGDVFEIRLQKFEGKNLTQSIRKYDLKPGEEDPGVFVYGGRTTVGTGNPPRDAITLSRFAQSETVLLPGKPTGDGGVSVDAEMDAKVAALKTGMLVEVEVVPGPGGQTLKSIAAYDAPVRMEMVKVVRQKVDDRELVGIEAKDASGSKTLLVDPKGKNASSLMSKVSTFSPGTAVLVRSTTDSRGAWLVDIRPAPKEDKPKDAPGAASKDAPKDAPKDDAH